MTQQLVRIGDYREVLDGIQADLIFTSPPYNIGSEGARRDGKRKKGKYDPKSYGAVTGYADAMPEDEYQDSQESFFLWAADHLAPGGVFVYNHKNRRKDGAVLNPASWFLRPSVARVLVQMDEIVWDRGSTHNHSPHMMWQTTERLYVFRRADDRPTAYNATARGLEFRSDVWRVPIDSRAAGKIGHNVPMPVEIASGVVAAFSDPGDLVVDPFAGSGTTGVAALNQGRRFLGAELLEKYARVANDRLVAEIPARRV